MFTGKCMAAVCTITILLHFLENYGMMKEIDMLEQIIQPLLTWYDTNHRTLPWRETKDPYHIWISEIMLQQTRVEAVRPYFERFIEALPTIHDLAICQEERLQIGRASCRERV